MLKKQTVLAIAVVATLVSINTNADARGTSVADNIQTVNPPAPVVSCEAPTLYQNPRIQEIVNGRIIVPGLRRVAQRGNALLALAESAAYFAANDTTMGKAYADLSVTGTRAFRNFTRTERILTVTVIAARARSTTKGRRIPVATLQSGANKALDRAYKVAHSLRFGNATPAGFRRSLGFITVSGENDLPWRPVNNDATHEFQYNLAVRVGRNTINTRFIVARGTEPPAPVPYRNRRLTAVPVLTRLPANAKVLVYVHGMDSRLEEASDMIKALRRDHPRDNWVVISMDLPTSGYATHLDHSRVAPLSAMGRPKTIGFDGRGRHVVKVLDFMTDFVIKFVETVDRQTGAKGKVWAVMGGSLGGNITFRLGRRNIPWIKNVITWSPGSIWDSFAGDIVKEKALKEGYLRAGGDPGKYGRETVDQRATFFEQAFGKPAFFLAPQDDQWWGNSFKCKTDFRKVARAERFEIYNERFRKWHWRLGAEQLLYTHQQPHNRRSANYLLNRTPMLLAAGEEDNYIGVHIHDATLKAARKMTTTPGRALFIKKTGHSIHNERPAYFTRQVVSFLKRSVAESDRRATATFRTVEIKGTTTRDDIRRNGNSRGWVGVKLRNGQVIWKEVTNQANKGKSNLDFRATVDLGGTKRASDIVALMVKHHSGDCFACARDYWDLRAELKAGGATLARSGDFRIGHQTKTFAVR